MDAPKPDAIAASTTHHYDVLTEIRLWYHVESPRNGHVLDTRSGPIRLMVGGAKRLKSALAPEIRARTLVLRHKSDSRNVKMDVSACFT